MRTPGPPGEDAALALGFLLSEAIVVAPDEVVAMSEVPARGAKPLAAVDVVRVSLSDPARARGSSGRLARAHEIRASCGLCGLTSAEGLAKNLPSLTAGKPRVALAALEGMVKTLEARQEIFPKTGGSHAAGIFSPAGELLSFAEDVGRHNALDKAIGRSARRDLRGAVAVLSGRGGFELVLKALRVGIAVTASVSASSSLAVALAEEAGGTLVGFVRPGGTPRVYADDGRIDAP